MKVALSVYLFVLLINLALLGGAVYVAAHFIRKFW